MTEQYQLIPTELPIRLVGKYKTCPTCNTNFSFKHALQRYCSDNCRKEMSTLKSRSINTIEYDNPYKNRARSLVIDQLTNPVRNAFMFPGKLCLDVKELIAKGFIDEYSKIHVFEEHTENKNDIIKFLNAMQIEHTLYARRYVHLKYLLSRINKEKSNLCWFDACQTMIESSYDWLHYNLHDCGKIIFEPGTLFAFSFVSHGRGNGKYVKVNPTQEFYVHNSGIENVGGSFSKEKYDEIMNTASTLIPFPIKYCDRYAYSSPREDGTRSRYTIYTYTFTT